MAQGIALLGDTTTGHGCFPPRPGSAAYGSSCNVFVNNIPVHCVGDAWNDHSCGNTTHSGTSVATGSSTIKAGGKAVARIGDLISCGDAIAGGSGNVFAS